MASLKLLLKVSLALALLVSITAHPVAANVTWSGAALGPGLAAGHPDSDIPCTGGASNCIQHICCIGAPALPTASTSLGVASDARSHAYDLAPEWLAGISVEPELSPPILAA